VRCQSVIGGVVGFPDQVLQRAIVFVVFLLIPDLERIGIKERSTVVDRFVIVEKSFNVRAVADQTIVIVATDKEVSGRKDGTGLGRVVHAINVAAPVHTVKRCSCVVVIAVTSAAHISRSVLGCQSFFLSCRNRAKGPKPVRQAWHVYCIRDTDHTSRVDKTKPAI